MQCHTFKYCEEEVCELCHHALLYHHRKTEDEVKQFCKHQDWFHISRKTDRIVLTEVIAVNLHGLTGMVKTFTALDDSSEIV